jgi:acetyl-CoA carboxylase carboxyl transferase subunit alpha
LKRLGLIDSVIKEPLGGIHRDPEKAKKILKNALKLKLDDVTSKSISQTLKDRQEKLLGFGKYKV